MFEGICEALTKEMEMLEEKYASGKVSMNPQDLEHIDKISHALKSLATYKAMEGSSEYGGSGYGSGYGSRYGSGEGSYARGRSRNTGRYISRDSYESRDEYSRY